jgi:hypothetical protein
MYRLFDGLRLYVQIDRNGSKCWRFKYAYLGKERRLALGKYHDLSLLDAREKRARARKLLTESNINKPAISQMAGFFAPAGQGTKCGWCGKRSPHSYFIVKWR